MAKNSRRERVLKYAAVFTPEEGGGYSVYVPALPGCFSQGETFEDAKANIKEAIELYLEDVSQGDLEDYVEVESFRVPIEVILEKV